MKINIKSFEYEPASSWGLGEEWDANISTIEIGGELMVEIRTAGPVDAVCLPEHVHVIRLSRHALGQLAGLKKMLDAQSS